MTLTQRLQPDLDPVQLGRLEELRRFETAEQMFSIERLRPLLVELVEDPALQQLLVGHADLDGMIRGAPASHGHIDGVAAAWRRADAVFPKLKFGNVRKSR